MFFGSKGNDMQLESDAVLFYITTCIRPRLDINGTWLRNYSHRIQFSCQSNDISKKNK
jgi:hypothetical protein